MHSIKSRPLFSLSTFVNGFSRNAAVTSAATKINEETSQLKSWKEVPGPSSWPIVGQLPHFLPGGSLYIEDGAGFSKKLYETYGPIIRLDGLLGRPPLIFLFDAESASQVLRGENSMPVRPGFHVLTYYRKYHKKTKEQSSRSTGLITDHGDLWKEFRSAVNPVLLQPKTIKLYVSVIDEVAVDMIARLKSLRSNKNMIQANFETEMNLWALESIGVVALGTRIGCLNPDGLVDSRAKRLIQCVHDTFVYSDELDFKPSIWRYYATPAFKKAMETFEEQENIAKYFVNKSKEELKLNSSKSDDEKGVLEKLLEINEEYAHIMANDMLFAGVDTAANTVAALLYLLAINQEKQNKLREEILSSQDRRPYLRACIKESMRLMPIVGGNIRQISKEYNILGYRIPKDLHVAFGHQDMSLMERYYPRPMEFIPERWIADKSDPLYHGNAHPFASNPFGFGVRSCVGRRIAELEMEIFMARLIENFKVEWFGPPPKVHQTSLNYIKGPFNFIFKDV